MVYHFVSIVILPNLDPYAGFRGISRTFQISSLIKMFLSSNIKVSGPRFQNFCIEKDSYMDAIERVNTL